MEPIAGYTRILEMLSSCLTKLIEAVKNIKSDPLKYTLLLGIVFQILVVFTHLVFSDIYLTTFISIGILFLGYMGYLTYNRDQERKSLDRINKKFQAIAEEVAAIRVLTGRKNR
jgi:hypothetical protein